MGPPGNSAIQSRWGKWLHEQTDMKIENKLHAYTPSLFELLSVPGLSVYV